MVDRLVGLGVALVTVLLLCVWSFSGIHPSAWEETAIAAGLLPQARLLPGIGTYLAHLTFVVFPYGTALFLVGFFAKLVAGACGYLAYGIFYQMASIGTRGGARDLRRRRYAARIAAAVAAFAFVGSQPMWMAAQGQFGSLFVTLLVLLACWLFTRLLGRASYEMAVATLLTLGVLCAESPVGWLLLVLFVILSVRFLSDTKDSSWLRFLDPMRMQKTKWSMTFAFLSVLIVSILAENFAFIQLDGLRAMGLTAGELPLAYAHAYLDVIASSFTLVGACLAVFAVVIPAILAFLLIQLATDEEQFLAFKHSIVYFLCGLVAFLQLSPFDAVWFWNQTEFASVSSLVLPFCMFVDAAVLACAVYVMCVEVLCRDYVHIENILYQGLHDEAGSNAARPKPKSVSLTPGRLAFLAVPIVLVALVFLGRRLPDDRRLQALVWNFVNETVTEAADSKFLFTDGAFDAPVRLESRRRGATVYPISMMGGKTRRDTYVRQMGVESIEDRMSLEAGAAEALRTWVTMKSGRITELSVQLGFEFFRLNRRLAPVVYGLLVRPTGGIEEAAAASIERCHALADAIVDIHASGAWRHAKDKLLKDRFLFAQFRLAVISRLRAINLDATKRVKESIAEIAYADRLNACNPSLAKILRRMDWIRRQNGEELTPREGLEVAMKRLDFNMARRYAHPILKDDPDDPNANFAVGMGFYTEEQYAKAEEYLKRVLKRKPDEPAVYNNLALVYLKTGRLEEAEKYAKKALELNPTQSEIKDTLTQIQKAKSERKSPFEIPTKKGGLSK